MAHTLKHRVFTCLTKLGDRDTYSLAAAELESLAQTLDPAATLSTFISCILSTDTADKPPVRRHCIHLLSLLAVTHGNTLSPYLSKILTHLIRRLRDPDSSIRSTCVDTVSTLSTHVTRPPFSSFLKPLSDALFTEQDMHAQIGSALCLAAAIDGTPDPDPVRLGKMVPRLEKLLKSDGYKAKAAVLVVLGSVIGSGGLSGYGVLRNLMNCLMAFLSSEEWAARKAAAEALGRLAMVERDSLAEFKAGCLKVFENRRFDKVKAVREVMNQMMDAWKQVPDVSMEESPPPRSRSSSIEDASDGRFPPGSICSGTPGTLASQMRKKPLLNSRSTPPTGSSARNRSPLKSSEKRISLATSRVLDRKKAADWKVEIAVDATTSSARIHGDDLRETKENVQERANNENTRFSKAETKRALFTKKSDDRMQKLGGSRSGSRVAPCHERSSQSTVVGSTVTEKDHFNHKECDELSSIRSQLVQIEKQQSSLLDMLQKFIGSSQTGMRSLETRVHGLELALDEISYDLAVSTGRMTNTGSHRTTCCMIPGADFLSSKFWRKRESSRFSTSSGMPSLAALRYRAQKDGNTETSVPENNRLRLQGGGGFIVNPLAEIPRDVRVSQRVHINC